MWGRVDRTGQWSFGEAVNCRYAYAQVSPHLVCVAYFEQKSIEFIFRHRPNPRRLLRKLDRWKDDRSYNLDIALKIVVKVHDEFRLSRGESKTDIFAHRIVTHRHWTMITRAVGSWHEACKVTRPTTPNEDYYPVIRVSAPMIGPLLKSGFDAFLDDSSIGEVDRSLMFLSVLRLAEREFEISEDPGDERITSRIIHLSADMCRSIIGANPVAALANRDNAFSRGLSLGAPVFDNDDSNSLSYRWRSGKQRMNDDRYRFLSVCYARMNDIDVTGANDWVIPGQPDRDPQLPYLALASWYDTMRVNTVLDDAMLARIGRLNRQQAIRLGQMLPSQGEHEVSQLTGVGSGARAKALILDFALSMAEADFGAWSPPGQHGLRKGESSQPWNTPWILPLLTGEKAEVDAWVYLTRETLLAMTKKCSMTDMSAYLRPAIIHAILTQPTRDERFIDVLTFWGEERALEGDYMVTFNQTMAYLAEPVSSPDDTLPFVWYLNLNSAVTD